MSWDAEDVALLKKLWAVGQSAAQIAQRLGYSRNAVCAKLTRLDLKRGHKPPTAKPKIRAVPKRRPALLAACARPAIDAASCKAVRTTLVGSIMPLVTRSPNSPVRASKP